MDMFFPYFNLPWTINKNKHGITGQQFLQGWSLQKEKTKKQHVFLPSNSIFKSHHKSKNLFELQFSNSGLWRQKVLSILHDFFRSLSIQTKYPQICLCMYRMALKIQKHKRKSITCTTTVLGMVRWNRSTLVWGLTNLVCWNKRRGK